MAQQNLDFTAPTADTLPAASAKIEANFTELYANTHSSTHSISQVTGLQTTLDGKQDTLAEGAFADGDKTKLDGIEAGADVTDATNVAAAGAIMNGDLISGGANNTVSADPKFWSGTQANYDAIATKDSNTFYFIEA